MEKKTALQFLNEHRFRTEHINVQLAATMMEEYSSLQSEEKDKEIERLREALSNVDHQIGCCVDGESQTIDKIQMADAMIKLWPAIQQALSNQPIESDKDRRIKELEEACTELNRFIPELRYLSKSGFQYPDNAIKALTQIEKLLTHN